MTVESLVRTRWRTLVFVAITLWLCGSVTVILFQGLGSARRSGAAEEVAAEYQHYLGRGWYPLEVEELTPPSVSQPAGWLGLNYSSGSDSTVLPAPDWRELELRLDPLVCSSGSPPTVTVRQEGGPLGKLVLAGGWHWYRIGLSHAGRPVTLTYSCILVQQSPGLGLQAARHLAIAVSGIRGSRS